MSDLLPNPSGSNEADPLSFRVSAIHGTGAFARHEIAPGERVIEYVGEKISKDESMKRCEANNEYIFALSDSEDLDGSVGWNPARFINHSCAPNCEARMEGKRIWIYAVKPIARGEEVTFNYGYDLQDFEEHPCRCGAQECTGYIVAEEFFQHVRSRARRKI